MIEPDTYKVMAERETHTCQTTKGQREENRDSERDSRQEKERKEISSIWVMTRTEKRKMLMFSS